MAHSFKKETQRPHKHFVTDSPSHHVLSVSAVKGSHGYRAGSESDSWVLKVTHVTKK